MKPTLAWLAVLFLVAAELHLAVIPAHALQQDGEYWFSETITLGAIDLPDGVSISTNDPLDQPRASLTIENQAETLLFVLSLNYKEVLVMDTPDPMWRERVELAHEVASYFAAPNHPAHLDMPALADLDHALEDRNVLAAAPPPPGTAVPAAQTSELLLVYDGQVILVPFTLSYQLNPSFETGLAAQPSLAAAQSANQAAPGGAQEGQTPVKTLAAVILLLGVGLFILGWLDRRRTRPPTP